jgi:predicted O-linked N-acetylglucosamine transferase (SPINDLY family)
MNVPEYDCETPYTKGLGGTQSALCYYAEALATQHTVTVIVANCKEAKSVRGVQFQPMEYLRSGINPDVVVCCSGVTKSFRAIAKQYLKNTLSVCWIPHNTNEPAMNDMEEVIYDYDVFAFWSEWQRLKYIDLYGIDSAKTTVMLHGISPGFQGDFDITQKKPYFIYISQPDRGLHIVADAWEDIVKRCPTAELHTYSSRRLYGGKDSEQYVALFDRLRAMPNVTVHDPVGQAELAARCREAAFLAYPTDFYETGCIALTESCAAGCLPIVSELGPLGTYFKTTLKYDETLRTAFIERACQYMDTFTNNKTKFYEESERIAYHYQNERNYMRLIELFKQNVDRFLRIKKDAVACFLRAQTDFVAGNYHHARLHLDNMPPLFQDQSHAFTYFLWKGVCNYHTGAYSNAALFFKKAAKWGNSLQLCVNMILTSEKLERIEEVIEWCEKALKYKFDMKIIYKILNHVQKRPYFERCKWGKYLLSLWNDDIQSNEWMSLFLSHGNMVVSDFTMVMQHEQGMDLLTNLIQKAMAFLELNKLDLGTTSQMRTNLEKLFSNLFLNMNYFETRNPEQLRQIQYYMTHLPALKEVVKPKFIKIVPGRKLRIGFLSGDLVYHPVSYILNGIVEHMNKDRYDIHIFSTTENKDNSLQTKIRKDATVFHELHGKSVIDVKDTIVKDDIDVLIEMTGHTSNGSELVNVLRWKPARVLANYFAYPNSYGLAEMDYKIGDTVVFPPGLERYYVEGFCKIKGGLHTYKPIVELSVNPLAHEGIMFGCTNNPKKYRPGWIRAVAKILKGVEGSKIKMRYFNLDDPSIQEFYWKEFEKHGITRDRVDLGLGETLNKYFEAYADMDICLDPYPYNGGTINIETLYAGLPYITLLGTSYVSRVGASLLHQVGHPELIARTEDQYVQMAIDLAKDSARIKTYKETLRADMMKSTLGDNAAFAREFETGIDWMLREKGWLGSITSPLSSTLQVED